MNPFNDSIVNELIHGDFFKVTGMDQISDEEKAKILQQMTQTIFARSFLFVYNILPPEDQKMFSLLPSENMIAFLEERGIDLLTTLIEEAARYRMEVILAYKQVAVGEGKIVNTALNPSSTS